QQAASTVFPYDVIQLAIAPLDRSVLHQRIEQRFKLMVEQGLVEEVRALLQRGDLDLDCPSIRAVGYRQVWQYLQGELDYQAMIERGVIATRQLAKRQFTWLKGWDDLQWLHTDRQGLLLASELSRPAVDGLEGQLPRLLALKYLARL
ncbi:MAG: tRNA (adenosine(37)-N6)-dimethylallyltransferase MiaA, partial [Sinobacterium sp.]|nr:tRNA (adenosine(37)-N6)-dimethylallyltransferase MiaA [Sinobacterium sp.]